MINYEDTPLWKNSIANFEENQNKKILLRIITAYSKFRDRTKIIGDQIFRDHPEFTIHDITHSDSLWDTASLISGSHYKLTPTEVFVFGGAILVHDLAMAKIVYSQDLEELKKKPEWFDTIVGLLRKKLGRFPTKEETQNPDNNIIDEVTSEMLRRYHSDSALELPEKCWHRENSEPFYLIEDSYLRECYGAIIGQIARSHWQSVDKLASQFALILGAPGEFPSDWTVNPLKIACLLRVADAAHLDDRRAPSFLMSLRNLKAGSLMHWNFQNLLFKPTVKNNRLLYTSKRQFKLSETESWWICYDTLRMVDHELRNVNSLLLDRDIPKFIVNSVANVDVPERLIEVIKTDGWIPLDIRIKVSDVANLAKHIGGEQLYGVTNTVPFRELLQNAADATRARRIIEKRSEDWGKIHIRVGKDSFGYWLEIEDSGLGMSDEVLRGPFLDFGVSYWTSELMRDEHPGLLSSGFQPTGQYGIGFFSVFMWSDRVKIITRCYQESKKSTRVLEFTEGMTSRPILRFVDKFEELIDGGTKIRIWMRDKSNGFHFSKYWYDEETFGDFCAANCLCFDIDVYVANHLGKRKVITASDWKTIDSLKLMKRVLWFRRHEKIDFQKFKNLTPVIDSSGNLVGRACITLIEKNYIHSGENITGEIFTERYLKTEFKPQYYFSKYPQSKFKGSSYGIISNGGFRVNDYNLLGGVLLGKPTTASREYCTLTADKNELKEFASKQAATAKNIYQKFEDLSLFAVEVLKYGGDIGDLPIAFNQKRGALGALTISKSIKLPDEILLMKYEVIEVQFKNHKFYPNVYAICGFDFDDSNDMLLSIFIDSIAKAWSVKTDQIRKDLDFSKLENKEIAVVNDSKIVINLHVLVIKKPT